MKTDVNWASHRIASIQPASNQHPISIQYAMAPQVRKRSWVHHMEHMGWSGVGGAGDRGDYPSSCRSCRTKRIGQRDVDLRAVEGATAAIHAPHPAVGVQRVTEA